MDIVKTIYQNMLYMWIQILLFIIVKHANMCVQIQGFLIRKKLMVCTQQRYVHMFHAIDDYMLVHGVLLGPDWFFRYHPQTQLLRLLAVDSISKQSYKPLQIASNRFESLKIKSWFQLALRLREDNFFSFLKKIL